MRGTRVRLPAAVGRPFQLFVNGVEQTEGRDYRLDGEWIAFERRLTPPRPETARSIARGFFVGRYVEEHRIDIAYHAHGRPQVISDLPFE